jgi:sugar phosphate isomerase/epimerase
MTTVKGPGIFLAQFMGDVAPFNTLEGICKWAAGLGFKGVQIPSWDARCIDLQKAAESKTYADEIKGIVNAAGLEITELSTHLQGQLVAVHPAYDAQFDGFAPAEVRGNAKARTEWAVQQLKYAAKASQNLGLNASATFSGALLWHTVYPWPQRPAGLVETGFTELAKSNGAGGLPYMNIVDGVATSSIAKFFTESDLATIVDTLGAKDGDAIFFGSRRSPLRSKVDLYDLPDLVGKRS